MTRSRNIIVRGLIVVGFLLGADTGSRGDDRLLRQTESGPVKVELAVEPAKPLIGDVVQLTITVTAEKDVELLMPEFGEALDRFTILDFVPKESIDTAGRTISVQKYRLQPPASGRQSIPPILIEFVDRRPGQKPAPEGLDAFEVLTERLEFEVQSVLSSEDRGEWKPPLGELPPQAAPPPSRWPWLVVGIVALVSATPFVVRWYLQWRRRSRRQSAYQIARSRLDMLLAKPRPTDDQVDPFYVELSAIVRRYLEDRFELRAPELTTEEFLGTVGESTALTRAHHTLLRDFLRQADLVKFAGMKPTSVDIDQSLALAGRFLDETREGPAKR